MDKENKEHNYNGMLLTTGVLLSYARIVQVLILLIIYFTMCTDAEK